MDYTFDPDVPLESAATPPASWYTDPWVFEAEQREVFEKSWVPVGRRDQVASPGQYFTGELAGNPYVVLRDEQGVLRALHNVCRHHAAVVAQECGRATEFVCPYHGWCYHLNGGLKRAPQMGRMAGVSREELSLPPIAVGEWGPFVLIDLDGFLGGKDNPRDLATDIGPISKPLGELGIDNLRWVEQRRYEMRCNWKVFVDNSLDGGYHVAYAHEDLAQGLEFDGYQTEVFDRSSIQICQSSGVDNRLGNRVMYAWLYPNFFVNRYGGMMDTNLVLPLSVDSCEVIFDFYVELENAEEAVLDEWAAKKTIRKSVNQSHLIQQEDIEICESTQRGMRSMSYNRGRYSAKLEKAVHGFHQLLWADIKHAIIQ